MFKNKFKTRPIIETITVGDCLRRKREELGLSLLDLSKKLGIKNEYLENLENGNYADLPPQVYVRGFIKSYANHLGVDASQLIKIYNRETSFLSTDEVENKQREEKSKRHDWKDYLAVTPKMLTFVFSFCIVSVLGFYFMHQINSFNSKPYLFIDSPSSDEVVKEKELWVNGKTEEDAILKINGQEISVGADGNFSQKITLAEGRNFLIVEAKNRFDRTDTREINIVYERPEEDRIAVEETGDDSAVKPIAEGAIVEEKETIKKEESGAVLGVKTPTAQAKTETPTAAGAESDTLDAAATPTEGGSAAEQTID